MYAKCGALQSFYSGFGKLSFGKEGLNGKNLNIRD